MKTHMMPMTYKPKIEGIQNGTIRQTIRTPRWGNKLKIGDKLIIYGWSGKPYRSPWNWRKEVYIKEIISILVSTKYILSWADLITGKPLHRLDIYELFPWEHEKVNELASLDGIDPPTGITLKKVLEGFHGEFTDELISYDIIRW